MSMKFVEFVVFLNFVSTLFDLANESTHNLQKSKVIQ